MTPLLTIDEITLEFGAVKALDTVSLQIPEGAIAAVIGPNGAGKTSLFNCISGVYRPTLGGIAFAGESLIGKTTHQIAALGVARMFQNLALFENLNTLDNLLVGCHQNMSRPWISDLLWLPGSRRAETLAREKVEWMIDFLDLAQYRIYPVGLLPYGVRKRIELGRALCMDAKLLLLDEPAAGLNQEETEELARYILDIQAEMGITQLLIEHELGLVLDLADQITVLDFGRVIAEGRPAEIRENPAVRQAYLGMAA